jgi:hypothetical protein
MMSSDLGWTALLLALTVFGNWIFAGAVANDLMGYVLHRRMHPLVRSLIVAACYLPTAYIAIDVINHWP